VTSSSRSGSVRACVRVCVPNAFQQISSIAVKRVKKGQFGSRGSVRFKGVSWGQGGSVGVKYGKVGTNEVKWGQEGPKGVKWGQVRLSRVKWGLVGNMVIGLVFERVRGWVSERFG
jgi:hypothetical protein